MWFAEGIETDREADLLRQYNAKYGQGYYFSRAVTEDEFIELLPCSQLSLADKQ